jgi:hypothetical protein
MPSNKQKVKKNSGKNNKPHQDGDNNVTPGVVEPYAVYKGLPREEISFLTNHVAFSFEPKMGGKQSGRKEYEAAFVSAASDALVNFHMCILHNALTASDIEAIEEEYASLLDVRHGAHAIGEKDSSKRSGTRMW